MIPAPTLKDVLEHITLENKPLCCILITPKFDPLASKEIIPRLGYLNIRTGQNIHFYLAGYYGYGSNKEYGDEAHFISEHEYPDSNKIPWRFSDEAFANFTNALEAHCSWTYSGSTEIIILNEEADFSKAIVFNIDSMIRDGAIESVNQLLEALIQYSRQDDKSIEGFSLKGVGEQAGQTFIDSLIEFLPKGVQSLSKLWTKGKHYTLDNIE